MPELVRIDGSYGEGGGQILRTSVSLAAVTGRAVEIVNVRARRARPGLQPQHLMAVRATGRICAARLEGDATGSSRLLFEPHAPPTAGTYRFEIGTAGAAPLVAQTLLVPLSQAEGQSRVTITGGTHVPHAPAVEYLEAVYLPALRAAGLSATCEYARAGFFPRGGGEIHLSVRPAALCPIDCNDRGPLTRLTAYILTAALPEHVRERGAATVERFMNGIGRPVVVERRDRPSLGPGAAVVLVAECEGGLAGFTALGARGKPMERVAEEACEQFLAWWKSAAAVDEHLADQLVLPAALAAGESRLTTPTVTEHLRTVLWVARKFLPVEVAVEEPDEGCAVISIRGSAPGAGPGGA